MVLKIVKSSEPIKVDKLKVLIYGDPGAGKTSLGFTGLNPILLDFDKGSHRATNRKDIIQVDTWEDAAAILDAEEELEPYDTIIVDTVGRMLDYLTEDIIANSGKAARKDGNLTINGYGTLKFRFQAFIKRVAMLNKDLILIAHDKEDKDGDEIIVRPDMTTSAYQFVKKAVDMMGNLHFEQGKRILNFNPTDKYVGKNCIKLESLTVPDDSKETYPNYMERFINNVRDTLNNESGEQQEANTIYREFSEKIKKAKKPADFDQISLDVANITFDHIVRLIQTQMRTKMKDLGIKYYKELGRFRFISEDNEETEKSSAEANEEKAANSVAATADAVSKEEIDADSSDNKVDDDIKAHEVIANKTVAEPTKEEAPAATSEPADEEVEEEVEAMAEASENPESKEEPEEPAEEEPAKGEPEHSTAEEPVAEVEGAEEETGYIKLSYLDFENQIKDKEIKAVDEKVAHDALLKGKEVIRVQIESDGETISKYALKVKKRKKAVSA